MEKSENKILILGVGNEILMDDGIGPKLVKELQKENLRDDIKYDTAFMGGLEILEYIQGYEIVIFIDAMITRDGIPGTVYQFTTDDFKETLHLTSLHDASFLTAIELGRNIGYEIPEKIHIIAVEIVEDKVFGIEFTKPLQEKYPEIIKSVNKLVRSFLNMK